MFGGTNKNNNKRFYGCVSVISHQTLLFIVWVGNDMKDVFDGEVHIGENQGT